MHDPIFLGHVLADGANQDRTYVVMAPDYISYEKNDDGTCTLIVTGRTPKALEP